MYIDVERIDSDCSWKKLLRLNLPGKAPGGTSDRRFMDVVVRVVGVSKENAEDGGG